MEWASEPARTSIAEYTSPFYPVHTVISEPQRIPSSPEDQSTLEMMFRVSTRANALLEAKETMDICQHVKELLPDELDEDFPSDLGKEFWKTLEKIATAWKGGLRAKVIQDLQSKGFSVDWFKWGYSDGFPILIVKLRPTPEPNMVWGIADRLHELIDSHLGTNTACLVHP